MQAPSVNFNAARNQAELDFQDIVDHPFEALKTHPGTPGYNDLSYWHGGDPLLSAISIGSLTRFGAINVDSKKIDAIPRYPDADESLRNKRFDANESYNDAQFHPVFRRRNFPRVDNYDYELLKPVLKLATDILGSFDTLGFFTGLLRAKPFTGTPEEQHRFGKGLLWTFSPEHINSLAQAMDAITHLRDLGEYVEWNYDDANSAARNTEMATWRLGSQPVLPHGVCSYIAIRKELRDALRRTHNVKEIHPEFTQASADLRVRFYMAVIMVHEIAHAFYNAFSPKPQFHEPFMNDDRVAELGYALITHLFGSAVRVAGSNPIHYGTPFGCYLFDWPNSDNYGRIMTAKHSLAKAGVHTHTYYALHMDHLVQILKPRFWREEAERFGDSNAMKLPKVLGARYSYNHQLWSGEGPVEMEAEAALPPGSLNPDVDEGIIWQDGAAALGLQADDYKNTIAHWTAAMKPWEFSDAIETKVMPLTWETIDRFHPEHFNIMTAPPPLNLDPQYDVIRYKYRIRAHVRKLKLEKRNARARKIAERRKRDKAARGPPVRKHDYDKIDYEAPEPPTPSPPSRDLGFYPRANPRLKDYDPDLEFPRVPYTGDTLEKPPPYNGREKWVPNWRIDFEDGGAYPEVHYQQYPLGMDEDDDSDGDSDGLPPPPPEALILD